MKAFNSRGDVSIYIALLMVTAMLSIALILQLIISRQFRSTVNVLSSERALYAANSGLERMLARLPYDTSAFSGEIISLTDEVPYDDNSAVYDVWGKFITDSTEGSVQGEYCVYAVGIYQGSTRYLSTGSSDCVDSLIAASHD